jgi:hypothetical protein
MTEHNLRDTAIRSRLVEDLEKRECELILEKAVKYETPNVLIKGSIDALAIKVDFGTVFEIRSGRKRDSDKAQLRIYVWMLVSAGTKYRSP